MSRGTQWYRSLYWRIAIGYVALLAVLLLLQTGLAIWLTDRVWGRASRTPAQLAELAASDLSAQLTANSSFDIQQHVRDRYRSGYQPFVVVVDGDPRTYSNRDPIPPNLFREAMRKAAKAAFRFLRRRTQKAVRRLAGPTPFAPPSVLPDISPARGEIALSAGTAL